MISIKRLSLKRAEFTAQIDTIMSRNLNRYMKCVGYTWEPQCVYRVCIDTVVFVFRGLAYLFVYRLFDWTCPTDKKIKAHLLGPETILNME